mmetsp:Transcript_123336/g.383829  ORF Transcript_123336/g.383829 Transcript_123336/m.383829 type:complete len:259 (-) Transcript_123336:162-938(-)
MIARPTTSRGEPPGPIARPPTAAARSGGAAATTARRGAPAPAVAPAARTSASCGSRATRGLGTRTSAYGAAGTRPRAAPRQARGPRRTARRATPSSGPIGSAAGAAPSATSAAGEPLRRSSAASSPTCGNAESNLLEALARPPSGALQPQSRSSWARRAAAWRPSRAFWPCAPTGGRPSRAASACESAPPASESHDPVAAARAATATWRKSTSCATSTGLSIQSPRNELHSWPVGRPDSPEAIALLQRASFCWGLELR